MTLLESRLPLKLALVLLAMISNLRICDAVTCYLCQYSTRPGVSYSTENCLSNLAADDVGKYDCTAKDSTIRHCIKGVERGTLNGQDYVSIIRSCVPDDKVYQLNRPCDSANKDSNVPIITRALQIMNPDLKESRAAGDYGSLALCVCPTDYCNDEPGYETTKGAFAPPAGGGGSGGGSFGNGGGDFGNGGCIHCIDIGTIAMISWITMMTIFKIFLASFSR